MGAVVDVSAPVVAVPTNRPSQRRDLPEQVFETEDEKWQAVVTRVAELVALGRPVLVGTRSVSASEAVSALLEAQGIEHRVLNAQQTRPRPRSSRRRGRRRG